MKLVLTESQLKNTIHECVKDAIYENIRNRVKEVIRESFNQQKINEVKDNPFKTEKQKKEYQSNKRKQKRLSYEEKVNHIKKKLESDEVNMAHYARKAFPQCTDAGARSYLIKCLDGERDWPEGVVDQLYAELENKD